MLIIDGVHAMQTIHCSQYMTIHVLSDREVKDMPVPPESDAADEMDGISNKCIGDDTKAVARQSLNCVKNKN